MSEDSTTPTSALTPEKKTFREEAWETFRFLCVALIIIVPLRLFVAQPFIVSGASMDPTFHDKQYLIVDELSYHLGDPVRGDVVIFKYPNNPSQYFIKRVIGLPGETVHINAELVTITKKDGTTESLKEPYITYSKDDTVERTLRDGEYFMMGDNRAGSYDSRAWGPVARDLIVGKAFLRLFPITMIDVLPGQFRQ